MTALNMQPSVQRSIGSASLVTKFDRNAARIADLYQQGCAKIRVPKNYDADHLEAVMINSAGGITGGDKLAWHFEASSHSKLTITSQACERLYRATQDKAEIHIQLTLQDNAGLNWLPQETILFDGSVTNRVLNVEMGDNARLLVVEPIVFGRQAMNEVVEQGYFQDRWRITHKGKLVHADQVRFERNISQHLSRKTITNGAIAMASVLLVDTGDCDHSEALIAPARSLTDGSASYLQIGETGKLIARIVAEDSYALRKKLIPLVDLLNQQAVVPKTWAI